MPELMGDNRVVLDIYLRVHNQHIMGFSGPVDLNFQSVKIVMDMLNISNQKEVFERVYNLYKRILKGQYEEHELNKELGK